MEKIRSKKQFTVQSNNGRKGIVNISYKNLVFNKDGSFSVRVVHFLEIEIQNPIGLNADESIEYETILKPYILKSKPKKISKQEAIDFETNTGLTKTGNIVEYLNELVLKSMLYDVQNNLGQNNQLAYGSDSTDWEIV